jgi:hypothetical protein
VIGPAPSWRAGTGIPAERLSVDLPVDPAVLPSLAQRWRDANAIGPIEEAIARAGRGESWLGRRLTGGGRIGLHYHASVVRWAASSFNGGSIGVRWCWLAYGVQGGRPIAGYAAEGLGRATPPGLAQDSLRHRCRYVVAAWAPWLVGWETSDPPFAMR